MAWPLALAYAALIVFASLFPFEDWRAQGIAPWEFLLRRCHRRIGRGLTLASTSRAMPRWVFAHPGVAARREGTAPRLR